MGCGKKAMHDKEEEQYTDYRVKRLEELGYAKIVDLVDALTEQMRYFEMDQPSLPRGAWQRVDRIKEIIKALS